jgi:hypothetical protein
MNTLRIAAWSGPRNISTAMMRSWENRPDTLVCDEPFYAHYLQETGLDHPGRDSILERHESNWEKIVEELTGPCTSPVYYQKQMTHHLLPDIDRTWLANVTNIFLIRHPREMMTSLVKTIPNPTIDETGLPQQVALFEYICKSTGEIPLVLDSKDILLEPRTMLTMLCEKLSIPFYETMLSWPAGKRDSDGIWAPHWYGSVEASTGFAPWKPKDETLPPAFESMCLECTALYEQLTAHTLNPKDNTHAPNI